MGLLKGKMCMNFKLPVYNQEEQIVAYVVQTVPLIPSLSPWCCCSARPRRMPLQPRRMPPALRNSKEEFFSHYSYFFAFASEIF